MLCSSRLYCVKRLDASVKALTLRLKKMASKEISSALSLLAVHLVTV